MDYEKAYNKALERAKSAIKDCGDNKGRISMIESIFPELKESEDDRIRKRLIEFFEDWGETKSHCWGKSVNKILAWLEKQGEKKSAWSDQDEENLQHCCGAIGAADYYTYDDKQDMEKWLLQLKERLS